MPISKMTLDPDAQLEQRVKREHGVRFDALVRSAEAQLHGAEMASDWETSGRRHVGSVLLPGDTTIFSRGEQCSIRLARWFEPSQGISGRRGTQR